jgi:serine/threonine protein kinase
MSDEPGGGSPRTPVTVPETDDAGGPRAGAESERYVLEREIGEGGMGRVFAARDLRLQRPVAIKMLKVRDGRIDLRYAARFEREVKLAARLQHPGVVPVYDAGFWPSGEPYLVMKLVLGQSLARVIRDAETPADRLALLPHVITAAEAVAYAHDQGVVHRDLKPINILVGAFGETIVLDWGLAKDLRAGGGAADDAAPSSPAATPAGDTAAGAVLGTPSYMAPEQAAGHAVDARADVYALGAILYHLLAGTVPHSPSLPGGAGAPARAAAVPLAQLEAWLPSDLRAIVEKAMASDAPARYPTAFELAEDLRRFQAGQLVAARRYSRADRVGRFVARNRVAVTVGIVAVGVSAALLLGK